MTPFSQVHQKLYSILHNYQLDILQTETLQNHGNLVVRVDTSDAAYVLRVCSPMTPFERLQEELHWLLALQRDTDLLVPVPVANEHGAFVTSFRTSEEAPIQYAVLFQWVEGTSLRLSLSPHTANILGVFLARLHHHAQSSSDACISTFVGPRYDYDWLMGPTSWWSDGRALRDLGSITYNSLQSAISLVGETMSRLGESAHYFGLIHADLHFDNILFQKNSRCALIDFGNCSLGYYLHDLAMTENAFRRNGCDQETMTAFREGYCREQKRPLSFFDDIDVFMIPVDVIFLEWILGTDNGEAREFFLPHVPQKIEHILKAAQRATHVK